MAENVILFIQRRCGKSGAPSALARLMGHPTLQPFRPVLLTSTTGWLTEECRRRNVSFMSVSFPGSRSPWARLMGNRLFAKSVRHALIKAGFRPLVVIGNDHLEGLLSLAVSRDWNARPMIFLRSSETTRRDFFKYHCHQFDRVYAVGDELYQRATSWSTVGRVTLLHDGLDDSDFLPPKPKAPAFPTQWLVAGSPKHDKGWQDFAAALDILETDPSFPALDLDFTGRAPDSPETDMHLGKTRRSRFHFIGHQENFRELLRQYNLVVHPAREESFGLAMIETLAAGVAMISSRAGVIEQIQADSRLLFPPCNPSAQAEVLRRLWRDWSGIDFHLEECQARIRARFSLNQIAAKLAAECQVSP